MGKGSLQIPVKQIRFTLNYHINCSFVISLIERICVQQNDLIMQYVVS